MTLETLNSDNIFLVDIDFMNKTHQEEITLVQGIMEHIKNHLSGDENRSAISAKLLEWLRHTEAHFSRENQLMQETHFPAFTQHSDEHKNALYRMQSVVDAWEHSHDIEQLKDYVFTLWPNWFRTHVASMDNITAAYAVQNGYKEK